MHLTYSKHPAIVDISIYYINWVAQVPILCRHSL